MHSDFDGVKTVNNDYCVTLTRYVSAFNFTILIN